MNAPRQKLDIDRTRERLTQLGCLHAAEQLDALLTEAVRKPVPAHEFLELLLGAEISGRESRRVKTALRLSNLPTGQTLANFDFAFQPSIEALASTPWPPRLGARRRDGSDSRTPGGEQNPSRSRFGNQGGRTRILGAVLPLR